MVHAHVVDIANHINYGVNEIVLLQTSWAISPAVAGPVYVQGLNLIVSVPGDVHIT